MAIGLSKERNGLSSIVLEEKKARERPDFYLGWKDEINGDGSGTARQ